MSDAAEWKRRARRWIEETFGLSYLDEARLYMAWGPLRDKVVPKMKTWVVNFWNDPAVFAASLRMALFALGTALHEGIIPGGGAAAWWAGLVFQTGSLLVRAGEMNQAPETIKAIAVDPTITPAKEASPQP